MRGADKHVNKYLGFSNVFTTSGYDTMAAQGGGRVPDFQKPEIPISHYPWIAGTRAHPFLGRLLSKLVGLAI